MSKINLHIPQEINVLCCQETLVGAVNVRKRDCLSKNGRWVRDDFFLPFSHSGSEQEQGSTNDLFSQSS